MFRNYLAAALRNLVRNRLYAAINIAGLSVGFAAALLIALFVRDEFSYDRFFPNYQQIYLLGSETRLPGRANETPDATAAELAPLLKADFPSVAAIARVGLDDVIIRAGTIENRESIIWADPTILDIFGFKVAAGGLENALEDSNSIVVTREMARKYFGRDDPVGETLEFGMITVDGGRETKKVDFFKVVAVIEDLPSNSNLNIHIIANARNTNSFIAQIDNNPPTADRWRPDSFTYLKLASSEVATQVQYGLTDFMKRHKPSVASPGNSLYVKLILRPIASMHLTPGVPGIVWKARGDTSAIYAMTVIGLLIVLAATINFVNLMTARAIRRATEVGVRKASGAARSHLITQFIGETTMYVVIGMACSFVLAAALLPRLNAFLDRQIALGLLIDIRSASYLAAFVIVVGFLAGGYPASVLASLRPAAVLRGIIGHGTSSRLRHSLVVIQFAVLIGLVIPTVVVYRQTQYALAEAQRLDADQVVFITGPAPCVGAFKDGLSTIPGVQRVACSAGISFGPNGRGTGAPTRRGPAKDANGAYITISQLSVSDGFLEFFGLKPTAGRLFSENRAADLMPADQNAAVQGAVVLNETAVRLLGYASPQDAIGRSTSLNQQTGASAEIIGVVPDFGFDAVHNVVPPTAYFMGRDPLPGLWVRIGGANAPETLAAIDGLWKQVGPTRPISRSFLDQRIATFYEDITRQGALFAVFAFAAVVIAALGLLGLALFTAEQRTKEIGIRKTMGARKTEIVRLLLWQFTKPVLWANLIAWPAAYFIMKRWLEGFAYHIDLSPWMFVAASALALAIALLTVIGHALIVARAQPVTALRYE